MMLSLTDPHSGFTLTFENSQFACLSDLYTHKFIGISMDTEMAINRKRYTPVGEEDDPQKCTALLESLDPLNISIQKVYTHGKMIIVPLETQWAYTTPAQLVSRRYIFYIVFDKTPQLRSSAVLKLIIHGLELRYNQIYHSRSSSFPDAPPPGLNLR